MGVTCFFCGKNEGNFLWTSIITSRILLLDGIGISNEFFWEVCIQMVVEILFAPVKYAYRHELESIYKQKMLVLSQKNHFSKFPILLEIFAYKQNAIFEQKFKFPVILPNMVGTSYERLKEVSRTRLFDFKCPMKKLRSLGIQTGIGIGLIFLDCKIQRAGPRF